MPKSARLRNVTEVRQNIRSVSNHFPGVHEKAQLEETRIELKEVNRRTPIDEGDLIRSEHIEGPMREGPRVTTAIVAGGPSAPHAYIVHEDLEAFHRRGQAKYIESVLLESRPHMASRIAKRIDLRKTIKR